MILSRILCKFLAPITQSELPHFTLNPLRQMKLIKSLKPKDSHGYDEISSRILKISAPCILSPLTYIFNKILHLGIFPDRMKLSIIRPLHKKGTTKEMENYRPISLLFFPKF